MDSKLRSLLLWCLGMILIAGCASDATIERPWSTVATTVLSSSESTSAEDPELVGSNADVLAVAVGPEVLVAVGVDWGRPGINEDDRASVWISTDGSDWSRIDSDPSFTDSAMSDVVWFDAEGLFVAVGNRVSEGAVWTSADGISWTLAAVIPVTAATGGIEIESIVGAESGLLAVGTEWLGEGAAFHSQWTSEDAVHWEPVPAEFPATRSDIGFGWESVELPDEVASCHQAVIPTNEEIVFWGGNQGSCEYQSPAGNPGMVYSPATGTWKPLPSGPLRAVVAPTGVWTGDEVLICCGIEGIAPMGGGEIGSTRAAAYDPDTEAWRVLPNAPLGAPFPVSVWTGTEMIVVTQFGVAGYNPASDTWRSYSEAPGEFGRFNDVVWTGAEVVVWPVWPPGAVQRRVMQGLALDPTADTWRVLPDPPAWPAAPDMISTGDSLIIWGGLPAHSGGSERAVGSTYDLNTDTWAALPEALPEPDGCECNLGSQNLTWTGEFVLVSPAWFSSGVEPDTPVLIAYHPASDTWILVDEESPLAWGGGSMRVGERLVMTAGPVLYVSPPNWQPTGEMITRDSWDR